MREARLYFELGECWVVEAEQQKIEFERKLEGTEIEETAEPEVIVSESTDPWVGYAECRSEEGYCVEELCNLVREALRCQRFVKYWSEPTQLKMTELEMSGLKLIEFEGTQEEVTELNEIESELTELEMTEPKWTELDGTEVEGSDLEMTQLKATQLEVIEPEAIDLEMAAGKRTEQMRTYPKPKDTGR